MAKVLRLEFDGGGVWLVWILTSDISLSQCTQQGLESEDWEEQEVSSETSLRLLSERILVSS